MNSLLDGEHGIFDRNDDAAKINFNQSRPISGLDQNFQPLDFIEISQFSDSSEDENEHKSRKQLFKKSVVLEKIQLDMIQMKEGKQKNMSLIDKQIILEESSKDMSSSSS